MRSALTAAVAHAARTLPAGQVTALAEAIATCDDAGQARRREIRARVATAAFSAEATRVIEAWRGSPVPGVAVALALGAAAEVAAAERAGERIEVVCTGPSVPQAAVRLTGVVIADVIREAQDHLLVVSFASYRVPAVVDAIRAAASARVHVDIVLESALESGGRLSHDAGQVFAELGPTVAPWHWPADRRPVLERGHAVLHAKSVVADRRTALVTSANLTEHGAQHNLELGLLVRGGPVPGRIADFFSGLMDADVLVRAAP
jgi:phosphatidylserine/phosphatidylglycerophosphate/cardiolipin synthase-like enzyme